MMKTKRLEILENSLAKKEAELDRRIEEHFATVRLANGQPLNDKRNGRAVMARWDRQSDMIRKTKENIEKTKNAIEKEKNKIAWVECFDVPPAIQELLDTGVLIQWRKHPNRFFVKGVKKGRIIYKDGKILMSYFKDIPNKEQFNIFRNVCNELQKKLQQGKSYGAD